MDDAPGVIDTVPVSWAYEYRISSTFECGKEAERAASASPRAEGWPRPIGGGRFRGEGYAYTALDLGFICGAGEKDSIVGEASCGVERYGDCAPSTIGSSARENEDEDELGE